MQAKPLHTIWRWIQELILQNDANVISLKSNIKILKTSKRYYL